MGPESGTCFLIETGIRGVVVPGNTPVVYVLFEPSTNYYRNMTGQSPLMPVLVNRPSEEPSPCPSESAAAGSMLTSSRS